MKKKYMLILFAGCHILMAIDEMPSATQALKQYKQYLIEGTYVGQDWSSFEVKPKSRYHTFKKAFEYLEKNNGKVIVELGTTRSFVHGGLIGCNSDDPKYWTPNNPENWDWGAGCFTRMAATCLAHYRPIIHTIDINSKHIERCKLITYDFKDIIQYHVISSIAFLQSFPEDQKVDLLYIDTGDITPIESTAQLQLQEAKIIVQKNLIADGGIILIDDVRNQTPKQFGETSELGKAKYSLPYFLEHGFKLLYDEYQVILQKNLDSIPSQ